jgi:hypothetical protein
VRRNPKYRSLLTLVSTTSSPPFHPLHHQRNFYHVSGPSCEPLYTANTSHLKEESSLWIPFGLSPFAHKEKKPHGRHFASEHAATGLLLRLSWSWAVLLPGDTHIKPITSITAVLLPFMAYLLVQTRKIYSQVLFHVQWQSVASKIP